MDKPGDRVTNAAMKRTPAGLSELVLKATPPRAPRNLLARRRLGADDPQYRDRPLIVVQAPAGFGKTSLLAQWRREYLARGAVVAWVSAQPSDDTQRFVQALAIAARVGCGRPTFGQTLLEGAAATAGELEGITTWLGEIAQTAMDVVLVVDDAERLPEGTLGGALAYLLHNQPSNLRVVVAARGELKLPIDDLLAYGDGVAVGAAALRFTLDETIALARARCGARIDADACARLHEITEGWPLGLQLALAAIERSADPRAAVRAMSAGSGDLAARLVGDMVAKLAPDDADFLTRVAAVAHLHPDLCRAITGSDDAAERLARLVRDTPVFVAGEGSEWCRVHSIAREVLRARFDALPATEQREIKARAARWLAEHGLLEEAARHALDSGQQELAYDLAEKSLYEAMIHGRQAAVLDWLEHLPEAEIDRRPRLRLAAAWALGLSERHEEAQRQVARILERSDADDALRYECALILSGAAYYADDPDRFLALFGPWMEAPPSRDPWLLRMHANRMAHHALLSGEPARARRYQQEAPHGDFGEAFGYAARWGEFVIGLSYLWEGQVRLAEDSLRPAVAEAEANLGRRAPLTCMLATLLAAAVWERDRPDEATALLANRLDVLERVGLPETVLLSYRTAARIAVAEGNEHRALDLLESLHAAGVARKLPRLCVVSLADQARLHARRFRPETCRSLCERIDAILARKDVPQGELWRRSVELLRVFAGASAAIASQDWPGALGRLARALALAEAVRLGRMRIEIMALRAFALERNGEDGLALLREAINLAETYGLVRLFADAHPALGDWAQRVAGEQGGAPARPMPPRRPPERAPEPPGPRAVPSMVLTPKEREVLELLARNLSNKEIALAMQVGEETVKWHLKNLFGKLSAGTRKHVVRRAHLLGLLEEAR
jgi:LuxR family transcriptional regulator, maltose regulon positive regulatory protein